MVCNVASPIGTFPGSVAELGEHHLRLTGSGVDWDSPKLVSQLYSLYLGSPPPAGKAEASSTTVR